MGHPMLSTIGDQHARDILWNLQNTVIQMIGDGSSLASLADVICRETEYAVGSGIVCSILLVEADGTLRTLAAPSLPALYSEALNGTTIGPDVGTCGTAAYWGRDVATVDLATDPNWVRYQHLRLQTGLKACWSSPIRARTGVVIGTFAFYFPVNREPSDFEQVLVSHCSKLCAIAIENDATRAQLLALGYTDALTGLRNRAAFYADLFQLTTGTKQFALLMLDLDNLKGTNDTLSHAAGDALIRAVARRLSDLGEDVSPYRLGGDEFALIVQNCHSENQMANWAEMTLEAVNRPVDFQGHLLSCYVTIGGVVGNPSTNAELLAQNADFALYHGKTTRRGGFVPYELGMRTAITRRLTTVALVDKALREDRVLPFYQPLIKLQTGEIIGLEALARIVDEDGNILAAGDFHEAFAESRLAQMMTDTMLRCVAADLRIWLDQGIPFQHVGVNVTTADFHRGDLDTRIASAFGVQNVPLKHIVLEVNEAVFMGGSGEYRVASNVEKLREKGLLVALDDFGTGYASLTHLLEFPVDLIKIDKSFVQRICQDRGSQAIVEALIDIAAKLNMKVVAEGVEAREHAAKLNDMGCNFGQGYFYSRPVPFVDATELLQLFSQRAKPTSRTAYKAPPN